MNRCMRSQAKRIRQYSCTFPDLIQETFLSSFNYDCNVWAREQKQDASAKTKAIHEMIDNQQIGKRDKVQVWSVIICNVGNQSKNLRMIGEINLICSAL